jgi:hypothetical protein
MAATESLTLAARLPGPPGLLPGRPDAIVDLQTSEGIALVDGQWRYADAHVEEIDFVELGSPEDPLGPGTAPNRTYDIGPHAEATGYDDSGWRVLARGLRHQRPDLGLAAQLHLDAHGDARLLPGRARTGRLGGIVRGRGRPEPDPSP